MERSGTRGSPLATCIRSLQVADRDLEGIVEALNDAYVQAYLDSDPEAFDALIARDFMVTLSDGRLVERREFLELVAQPHGVHNHRVENVRVRLYGPSAIVTAEARFRQADGAPARTRYTDVYVLEDERWVAASAHLTRVAEP